MVNLSDKLLELVIKHNQEQTEMLNEIIDAINNRLTKCADYGYTEFLIQFTLNENLLPNDHWKVIIDKDDDDYYWRGIILFVPNKPINNIYINYIMKYYNELGIDVFKRSDDSLIISWHNIVSNYYKK